MNKDEMKNKYSTFISEISEILGLGKPVDILKLCATTDLFFKPLEKQITELEKENAELKSFRQDCVKLTEDNVAMARQRAEIADQLTKAKEIIKYLLGFIQKENYKTRWDINITEAEQFLKDSEVEK